ncbi:MAG: thiamine pyrophosphate-dependent dehydrogenase E1 component subunit alpha [Chloroflexota bacterium]
MTADLWDLYVLMYKSRIFEEAVRTAWKKGLISGEMHLGMGEEAICAGIISQLVEGDAMALDHRGTPPMIMRGVSPAGLMLEFMGKPGGLSGGQGGHMHLFDPGRLIASSGIVGAAGPAAVGFALSGQVLRTGSAAIAFFGDGASNAGMLMESLNLAVLWKLPVIFVCKDNDWAISTPKESAVAGSLLDRARGFGMPAFEVNGADVLAVQESAHSALKIARSGAGPVFLLAHCVHLEGHFLGDGLLDMVRRPVYSFRKRIWPMTKGFFRTGGALLNERVQSMKQILGYVARHTSQTDISQDPVNRARIQLLSMNRERLIELETGIRRQLQEQLDQAMAESGGQL